MVFDGTRNDESPRLDLESDGPLVRAMGGALSLFATLLSRRGIVDTGEVANLLGVYAVATSETGTSQNLVVNER